MKPFLYPREAALNLRNCLQLCHSVAKLHCGKCRQQVLKRKKNEWNKKGFIDLITSFKSVHKESNIVSEMHTRGLLFKPGAYITHNANDFVHCFLKFYRLKKSLTNQ